VIFGNRSYNILHNEMKKIGVANPGQPVIDMFSLDNPSLDWVAIARGHGVPGCRSASLDDFAARLSEGLAHRGPYLIELVL
jgi:acetolactate synthase-1/2/3 large subunit